MSRGRMMAEFWKRDRGGVVELQYQFIFGVCPGGNW